MALTRDQLLGRRIDQIFVSAPVPMTGSTNLYTFDSSPWIADKYVWVAYVGVQLTAGSATGSSQVAFGYTSGGNEWTGTDLNFAAYTDSPAIIYPTYVNTLRPGPAPIGTSFWMDINTAFNAGTKGVITLYGWTL